MKKILFLILFSIVSVSFYSCGKQRESNTKNYTLIYEAPCLPEYIIFYDETLKETVTYSSHKAKNDNITEFTCQYVKISLKQKYSEIIIKDTIGYQKMFYTLDLQY
jgi:hypothetical protein